VFVVGVIAGAVALLFSYDLRTLGGIFVPELASQALFSVTPGTIESQAIAELGSLAKYSAFSGAIVGCLVVYGAIGVLLLPLYRRLQSRGKALNMLVFMLVPFAIMLAIAVVLTKITEIASQPLTLPLIALFLVPPHVAFGLVFYYLFAAPPRRKKPSPVVRAGTDQPDLAASHVSRKVSRKEFISIMGVIAGGSIASALFYQWFSSGNAGAGSAPLAPASPTSLANSTSMLPAAVQSLYRSEITPSDEFYRVDTNIVTPLIDASMWSLMVGGLVNNSLSLSYEDLKSMPSVERYVTLECVSNQVGGDLTSTAHWKGVMLKDVLEKAGIKNEATYIVFRCYDGYDVGVPLDRGLGGAFLAYELNGSPLPRDHGYPLRAIVPGLYGMMNPKWITSIELVGTEYEGFWQRRGWSNDAMYKIHSTIVVPGNALAKRFGDLGVPTTVKVGSKVPVAGVAFAGDRGISKVELSTDGGNTWQPAHIKQPLSSANTWVLWSAEWSPPSEGRYEITVRAFDGSGNMQGMGFQPPFPSGSSGYHTVSVTATRQAA
jgi:DMSO/TMAO reductase YedYZ molybdopterin-dependent catalytic subunit